MVVALGSFGLSGTLICACTSPKAPPLAQWARGEQEWDPFGEIPAKSDDYGDTVTRMGTDGRRAPPETLTAAAALSGAELKRKEHAQHGASLPGRRAPPTVRKDPRAAAAFRRLRRCLMGDQQQLFRGLVKPECP